MVAPLARQSLLLAAGGAFLLAYPSHALSYTVPAAYEVELVRWLGVALLGLAGIRPWALGVGGRPATRMRRWTRITLFALVLYVFTTNPIFLIVGFSTVVGASLDAGVERSTIAAEELLARLVPQTETE